MLLDMERKKCRTLSVSGSLMSSTCSPLGSSTVLYSRISFRGFTISASTNNPILLMISCNTKRETKTIEQGVLWNEHPSQHSAALERWFVLEQTVKSVWVRVKWIIMFHYKDVLLGRLISFSPFDEQKRQTLGLSSQAGSGYWSPASLGGSSASPRGAGGYWGHKNSSKT